MTILKNKNDGNILKYYKQLSAIKLFNYYTNYELRITTEVPISSRYRYLQTTPI